MKRSLLVVAVSVFPLDYCLPAQTLGGCGGTYTCTAFLGETFPKQPVPATSVSIGNPTGLAADAFGNLYIAGPSIVFRMDPAGMLTRIAGNGHNGFSGDGGPATEALLGFPRSSPVDFLDFYDVTGPLAVDPYGNLFIGDFFNNRIRKVTPDGLISTVAGGPDSQGQFPFVWPGGVAVASTGLLLMTDQYAGVFQISADGNIVPLVGRNCSDPAGTGVCVPIGLAAGPMGDVYITDVGNCRILHRGSDGALITLAGPSCFLGLAAQDPSPPFYFGTVYGLALDKSGNLYAADADRNVIRKIGADGTITTVAGTPPPPFFPDVNTYAGDGGPATKALVNHPHAVAVDYAGNVYIADSDNFVVRKVTPDGIISTVAGNGSFTAIGASMSANPNPCVLAENGLCTSYINWTTTGITTAQVWVKLNNGPESLFGAALSCSNQDCAAPWIEGNGVYTFTLYNCDGTVCSNTDHGSAPAFGSVQVTADPLHDLTRAARRTRRE